MMYHIKCMILLASLKLSWINVSSELVDANEWTFSSSYTLRPHSTIKAPTTSRKEPDLEMTSNHDIWKNLPVCSTNWTCRRPKRLDRFQLINSSLFIFLSKHVSDWTWMVHACMHVMLRHIHEIFHYIRTSREVTVFSHSWNSTCFLFFGDLQCWNLNCTFLVLVTYQIWGFNIKNSIMQNSLLDFYLLGNE